MFQIFRSIDLVGASYVTGRTLPPANQHLIFIPDVAFDAYSVGNQHRLGLGRGTYVAIIYHTFPRVLVSNVIDD